MRIHATVTRPVSENGANQNRSSADNGGRKNAYSCQSLSGAAAICTASVFPIYLP